MRRPLRLFLAVCLGAGACSTTRSSAGPFVSDVRVVGDRMVVTECQLDYTVDDNRGAMVVLLPLMIIAAFGGGGGGGDMDLKAEAVSKGACSDHSVLTSGGGMP